MTGTEITAFHPPKPTGTSLELAPEAWKLATRVAGTDFVPGALRGKPEAVLACILAGHEAGISPMQALSKIHVVDGRPAMAAELMRALVLRAGHEIWVEESTNTRVVVKGSRAGSERVSTVTWTLDDAKRAKLDGRNNWRNYPRAMMLARASTELCRQLFPDVLAGISHSIEELGDGDAIDIGDVSTVAGAPAGPVEQHPDTAPQPLQAKQRAAAPAKPDQPAEVSIDRGDVPALPGEDVDDETDVVDAEIVEVDEVADHVEESEPVDEDEVPPLPDEYPPDDDPPIGDQDVERSGARGPMTGPQMIAVRMGDLGIKSRDDKLAAVSTIVGHNVETSKDLEPAEVRTVLEWLESNTVDTETLTLNEIVSRVMVAEGVEIVPETGTGRRTAVSDVSEWDEDRWRGFVKAQKLTIPKAIKIAQTVGAEQDPVVKIVTLGDLVGSSIGDEVAARMNQTSGR